MYTYVRSVVKDNRASSRYREVSLLNTQIDEILVVYKEVRHVLTHPAAEGFVTLVQDDVIDDLMSLMPGLTIKDWLVINGGKTLPTLPGEAKVEVSLVKASDAWAAGFRLNLTDNKGISSTNISPENLVDIVATKDFMDYKKLYEHSLVSVNGLFHLTDTSDNGLIIKDGGKSLSIENNGYVSIMSFASVGKVKCYPITEEMVIRRNDAPYRKGFNLSLPGEDFSDKTVMLSIGGFLHFDNQGFRVLSDKTIYFDWWRLDISKRYLLSRNKIDFSKFAKVIQDELKDPVLAIDETLGNSDEAIMAYLTMSQSFVIVVDAKDTFFDKTTLERTPYLGRYLSYVKPVEPLMTADGMFPPYVVKYEEGIYCTIINDNWEYRYVDDTTRKDNSKWFVAGCISQYPKRTSDGYLISIGKECCDVK